MTLVQFDLSQIERQRLEEFLRILRTPCKVVRSLESFFNTPDFEEAFRSRLLTHHCLIGSPLFQESFDSAFISSCRDAGMQVEEAPPGQRFWDVVVAGKHVSLKSSKAKSLKAQVLHVSKLTEAAWIQDCRTAKRRREQTLELFETYTAQVDAIIQLRYFERTGLYELVEIPVAMFRQIKTVGREYFDSDGPTINIPIGANPPDFTLKLDRSDAKITIANINKDRCLIHGTWLL